MRQQVAEGHRKEFAAFGFGDDVPDPEDPSSYEDFKLKCEEIENGKHAEMLACEALEDRQVALRGRDGKDGD